MKTMNEVEVYTPDGYRSFSLLKGDITELDFPVDLLVISSFGGDLSPMTGTLIGALSSKLGISVERLKSSRELDLIKPLHLWVSGETHCQRIRRIMCVQIPPGGINAERIIKQAFFTLPILEARGLRLSTICLPMLGTGAHGLNPRKIVSPILEGAQWALRTVKSVDHVFFVMRSASSAKTMSDAMDAALERVRTTLPNDQLVHAIRKTIEDRTGKLVAADPSLSKVLAYLRDEISGKGRSSAIGIAGRKLREQLIESILPNAGKSRTREEEFKNLREKRISEWIISYLNLLRTFGNEEAHETKHGDRIPPTINSDDLVLCLFAIQRILDFWLGWISIRQPQRQGRPEQSAIKVRNRASTRAPEHARPQPKWR